MTYNRAVPLGRQVSAAFYDAGHILGSAMIEVVVQDRDRSRRLLFSGDLGQPGKPFVHDPTQFTQADYLVVESTYGNRTQEDHASVETQLADAVNRTAAAGGKLIIPIFAIERAQELIYYLGRLLRAGRIPSIPAFLDSPMAARVTEIFRRYQDWFGPAAQRQMAAGDGLLGFPGLTVVETVEQSKRLNHRKGPAIIMATSGMCTAGRIKHHLAQYIDKPECTILFVGYQAAGTLGRQILDGNREVRLHGRYRLIRARVEHVVGFSGHADRAQLLQWLGHFTTPPEQLFVTHGEVESALALAQQVRDQLHWTVTVPEFQQVVEVE